MHKAALPVVFAAFALQAAAAKADIKALSAIPDAYWGKWAPSAEACKGKDKDGDREAIVLAAKTYAGPLGTCEVASVTETASPKGSIYSARMLCVNSGKAQKKAPAYLIIRPGDANQISIGSGFDSIKTYQRCSENSSALK